MGDEPKPLEVTLFPDGVVTPCLIVPSRYGGVYEGGAWLAFPTYEVPEGVMSGDPFCAPWFAENGWWVGAGDSPDAALASLVERLEAAQESGRASVRRADS